MYRIYQIFVICLSMTYGVASASIADPQNGTEYVTLPVTQPVTDTKKVEVVEIFGYFCPHCASWDAGLTAWVKQQDKNIAFRRIVVYKSEKVTVLQQRMYLALENIGKLEEIHPKVFHALQQEHQKFDSEDAIIEFVTKQGVDKQKFVAQFNDFSVQIKANKLYQSLAGYQANTVPTIVIDGRFVTSPTLAVKGTPNIQDEAGTQSAALQVMTTLVQRVKASKGK